MPGDRYPDADILNQRGHWDEATRKVIMDRVHNIPPFRHFASHRRATLEALCARVAPQKDRPSTRQIAIAPWIDAHCYEHIVSGFRFDNMPSDEVAWEWGIDGIDQTAQALFGRDFVELAATEQDRVLNAIREGDPPGEVWTKMPADRWWVYVALRQIYGIYYSHPNAWDEIGFGGPAYPRGYFALNNGAPEPWEAREAPPNGRKQAR